MIKTYKSLDELLCISDCARVDNCKLISFNKINNICKYYRYYLLNETTLIESNGHFIYNYQISKYTYQLQGIQHLSIPLGCNSFSLITLPNGNIAAACSNSIIKIYETVNWTCISILTNPFVSLIYSLVILQNKYLACAGQNGAIAIWDYKTGVLKNTFYGHNDSIYSMIELNNNDLVS